MSLTLIGWGSGIALAYSTSRVVYVLADLLLHDRPTIVRTVGSAAAIVGLCGLAIGVLAPRVVPGLDGWVNASKGTRRLQPLWRDLTTVFPQVALATGVPITPHRAALRYDRRLLEVSEALAQARIPYATRRRRPGERTRARPGLYSSPLDEQQRNQRCRPSPNGVRRC